MSFKNLLLAIPLVIAAAAVLVYFEPNTRQLASQYVFNYGTAEPSVAAVAKLDAEPTATDAQKRFDQPLSVKESVDQYISSKKPAEDPAQLISYGQEIDSEFAVPQLSAAAPQPPQTSIPVQGLRVPSASNSGALVVENAVLKFVNDIDVVAQADGLIMNLLVDEGSLAKAGVVLVEIDSRLAKSEVKVAEKKTEAADLKASDDSNIKFSKATFDVAENDWEASQRLFKDRAESRTDFDKKRLEFIKAGFQVDVSGLEKKREQAEADVARAQLEAANLQVTLRSISTPFDGIVVSVEKEQYDWVRAGEKILRYISPERIRVKGTVEIREGVTPNSLLNAPARVKIDIAPGVSEYVDSVVGYVSFSAAGTDKYPVWVEISNRLVDGQYLFRDGMSASLEITPKASR